MSDSIVPPEGEHLMNGWEPDVPVDDTLKRRAVLAHAAWPVTDADAESLVDEIGELIPPGTTYFLVNPWLGPDLTPYGLA